MHRLIVAVLAAVNAAIAAEAGMDALLTPLTILWVVVIGVMTRFPPPAIPRAGAAGCRTC